MEPYDVTSVDGIPTLNKAATLCWLGAVVDTKTLERCLDEYLRTESVRWLDETMERLGNRKPGGVRALAELRNSPNRVQGVTDSQTRNPGEFAALFASAARKRAEQLGVAIQEAG